MPRLKGSKNKLKTETAGAEISQVISELKIVEKIEPVIERKWCKKCQRGHDFINGLCPNQ